MKSLDTRLRSYLSSVLPGFGTLLGRVEFLPAAALERRESPIFANPRPNGFVCPCAAKTCAVYPVYAQVVGKLRAADPSICLKGREENASAGCNLSLLDEAGSQGVRSTPNQKPGQSAQAQLSEEVLCSFTRVFRFYGTLCRARYKSFRLLPPLHQGKGSSRAQMQTFAGLSWTTPKETLGHVFIRGVAGPTCSHKGASHQENVADYVRIMCYEFVSRSPEPSRGQHSRLRLF